MRRRAAGWALALAFALAAPAASADGLPPAPNASLPTAPTLKGEIGRAPDGGLAVVGPLGPSERRLTSNGSGFYISQGGAVLTAAHVVDECPAPRLLGLDGARRPARVVAVDAPDDLALLVSDQPVRDWLAIVRPDGPLANAEVMAIGYPLEGLPTVVPTVSPGRVLRIGELDGRQRLAFAGTVRPGNSGGPLLDSAGRLVGVVSARINTVNVATALGVVPADIGFAVPVDRVLAFLGTQGAELTQAAPAATPEGVAEFARRYTVRVECWNGL